MTEHPVSNVLADWRTILGNGVELGEGQVGRDLWPVTAEDGAQYFLKRLGPWRNLPLADEARVLRYLSAQGIGVAEFLPTDAATLYAGEIEESWVLMPKLANDHFDATELVALEGTIGRELAKLHRALAGYPWPVHSYTEQLRESLAGDLQLPPDLAVDFTRWRDRMIDALTDLPTQICHGDMTPDNVLLSRPGGVSGFIDFDHLPLAPRIWDISKYLSRRIRLRWRQGATEDEVGRLDSLAGFLRGYHQENPLGDVEIAALPHVIAAANVLEVSYFEQISAGVLVRRKLPDHAVVLADSIEAAKWHLAHFDAVLDAVQSALR